MTRSLTPEEFRQARLKLGLTQSQLAEQLDLGADGQRAIRRYEQGDRGISGPIRFCIKALLDGYEPPGWNNGD